MYFPEEGIFGVTLWIVSTVVFHFVLFGIIAQRMGLGQFFVDVATVFAGRYTGGLAKVSVVSSAFFGTISGSSIANTVSTGSLTIPNMKRMGYPGHLAGGVEAAASAGGQITPPLWVPPLSLWLSFSNPLYDNHFGRTCSGNDALCWRYLHCSLQSKKTRSEGPTRFRNS